MTIKTHRDTKLHQDDTNKTQNDHTDTKLHQNDTKKYNHRDTK